MSLDGRVLAHLGRELNQALESGRIQKIYQLAKTDFLLMIRTNRKNEQLYLSLSPSVARIHLSTIPMDKPDIPGGFCMLLRKYFEGGTIQKIRSVDDDRIIEILVESLDELGSVRDVRMYLELMGRSTNLVVTDGELKIIDSYRHVSPTEDTGRTIVKGATYLLPLDDKISPEDSERIQAFFAGTVDLSPRLLVDHFRGFSPLLANYIFTSFNSLETKDETLSRILMKSSVHPTMYRSGSKTLFYYFDLFPDGEKTYYPTISRLLEVFYLEGGQSERGRQMSKNLNQYVNRELDKNTQKLRKLTQELANARQADLFRIKGNLILEHQADIVKGMSVLLANAYELGRDLEIELDPLLGPIANANHYFRKYKKAKSAILHLMDQQEITRRQIDYFAQLSAQIGWASPADLDEIMEECAFKNISRTKKNSSKRRIPSYDTYRDSLNCEILVGKNNLQNRYLTHEIAHPDDWWFHCKDHPGAHVIIRTNASLEEPTIRAAAQLAAIHSPARFSSSVPVDYTRIRYVKRISGELGAKVTYSHHQTIYIDPDPKAIESLKITKK